MTFIACKLSRGRLLVLFGLLSFSLLIFQPWVVSYGKNMIQGVRVDLKKKQTSVAEIPSKLSELGPVFPAAFSMSSFSVEGLVKGKWPIAVEYELEAGSTAEITVTTNNGRRAFPISLPPTNGERRELKAQLPEAFGQVPQLGVVSFRALKNGPEPRKPARFFLYGLGVGDKAVGSMVIVKLRVQPGSIRPKLKEKASYSFRSLSDFNKVAAEFSLATVESDGSTRAQLAYSEGFKNGVRGGQSVEGNWDGKNDKGKISPGPHQFHVRAWRDLRNGGDWAFAAERELVRVETE